MDKIKHWVAAFSLGLAFSTCLPKAHAVVSNLNTQTVCALGNSSTTNYTIGFDFRHNSDVKVYLQDNSTTPSTSSLLVFGSGAGKYTFSAGDPATTVILGTAPSATQQCIIQRVVPYTQTVSYDATQAFPAKSHEAQMDKQIFAAQQVDAKIASKIGLAQPTSQTTPVFPGAVSDTFLLYNHAGTNLTLSPATPLTGEVMEYTGSAWGFYNLGAKITEYDAHEANTSNPHNVTAAQVGNTSAQWNANKINSIVVDTSSTVNGSVLTYDTGTGHLILSNASTLPSIGSANTVLVSNGSSISYALIANASISNTAAIAYSKLNLTGAVLDADLAVPYLKADGTRPLTGSQSLAAQNLTSSVPNAGSTGTTNAKVAKITSSGAVIATTADTNGVIGIVSSGGGTSGSAEIATIGQPNCVFDNATTDGDYVVVSTTATGDCHDAGSTAPTGVQVLGRVLSTNGGAGTYAVLVTGGGGGGGVALPVSIANGGTGNTSGSATNSAVTEDTSTNAIMFPTWVTANTGNVPIQTTSTKLRFNPSTGGLSATTFTGAGTGLTGTGGSFTAGNATNAVNGGTVPTSSNASFFPLFVASNATTNQPFNLGAGLTFNPSTNSLATTTFVGALTGTASGPGTTKGDTVTFTSSPVRHAAPGNGLVMVADSSQTDGWRNGSGVETNNFNMLTDAAFESGAVTTNWTASGGTFIATTSANTFDIPGVQAGSWDSSAAAQTLDSVAVSLPPGNYAASCRYKCSSGNTCTHTLTAFDSTNSANLVTPFSISSNTTQFVRSSINFVVGVTTNVKLRTTSVASNEPIVYVDNCYLGPADLFNYGPSPNITNWTAFTPTGSWATNCSTGTCYTGAWRQKGDSIDVWYQVALLGAPTSATLTLNMPAGLTVDTTKLPSTSGYIFFGGVQGKAAAHGFAGACQINGSTSLAPTYYLDGSTASIQNVASITQAAPYTFANADNIAVMCTDIPVVGLSATNVYRPDQTPMVYSGSFASACSWARTSNSQGDFGSGGGSCVLTQRQNINAGTVTIASGTLPGITVTLPHAGLYFVTAFGPVTGSAATTSEALYLTDGTTTFGTAGAQSTSTSQFTPLPVFGVYNATSAGPVTLKLQGNANAANTINLGNAAPNSLEFSIFEITQNMPAPLLVNTVTSGYAGVDHIERVSIGTKCTAGTCTMDSNTPGISNVTRGGVGAYSINFAAGAFSSFPSCAVSGYVRGTGNGWCQATSEGNTTSQSVLCSLSSTGAAQDDAFTAVCVGPK